jgi:hypothetical protein
MRGFQGRYRDGEISFNCRTFYEPETKRRRHTIELESARHLDTAEQGMITRLCTKRWKVDDCDHGGSLYREVEGDVKEQDFMKRRG